LRNFNGGSHIDVERRLLGETRRAAIRSACVRP
jgi:hypothetical protein